MYINLYSIFSVKYLSCQDIFYIYIKNKVSRVCIYLYKDDPNTIYLADLYVDSAVRNKGIGTFIMHICDNIAMQLKASKIVLFVEKSWVKRWYEKLGYREIKEFTFPVDNAIWMEKDMRKTAFIFDIDGVLANISYRKRFIEKEPKDWDSFYKNMDKDMPIQSGIDMVLFLSTCGEVLFVTGRAEEHRKETVNWLNNNLGGGSSSTRNFINERLYMRETGDYRPDYIIKKEIYRSYIEPFYKVYSVFEDRKQCVNMWRKLGLLCWQNVDGDY